MITYDLPGTEQSMTAMNSAMGAIMPYVNSVLALPLGPQPMTLDGQPAGTWDPFDSLPSLKASFETIQGHCNSFQSDVSSKVGQLSLTLSFLQPTIQNRLSSVLAVVESLQQSGPAPTSAQRQTVDNALHDLSLMTREIADMVTVYQPATDFMDQLSGDVQALTQGSSSISNAQNQLNQVYDDEVQQYLGLGGSGIITILENLFGQMLDQLTAIKNAITSAVASETSVPQALSRLQTIFTVLRDDYATTAQAISAASDAEFASVVQELDIQNAQSYWQNATQFALNIGL